MGWAASYNAAQSACSKIGWGEELNLGGSAPLRFGGSHCGVTQCLSDLGLGLNCGNASRIKAWKVGKGLTATDGRQTSCLRYRYQSASYLSRMLGMLTHIGTDDQSQVET